MVTTAYDSGDVFDAIFVDLCMPMKDGWEAIKEVRTMEQRLGCLSPAYVIALSGSTSPVDVNRALECGADVFLPKPATRGQMAATLLPVVKQPNVRVLGIQDRNNTWSISSMHPHAVDTSSHRPLDVYSV